FPIAINAIAFLPRAETARLGHFWPVCLVHICLTLFLHLFSSGTSIVILVVLGIVTPLRCDPWHCTSKTRPLLLASFQSAGFLSLEA
ncbi:uncharacterized protein P884DRAFT_220999, partial [Thermothelomyces heterothallicus CBS 202.75]|uniref:uncharacterized protein n=1 Tax=Thermothelomyces heterothallicus CBS 202.75 TaxID=1149848 RepID=UPI003743E1AA